jgi:hypothetical protein
MPSLAHGTLWKLFGALTWAQDDEGVFTTMSVTGLGSEQAGTRGPPAQQFRSGALIIHDTFFETA